MPNIKILSVVPNLYVVHMFRPLCKINLILGIRVSHVTVPVLVRHDVT